MSELQEEDKKSIIKEVERELEGRPLPIDADGLVEANTEACAEIVVQPRLCWFQKVLRRKEAAWEAIKEA